MKNTVENIIIALIAVIVGATVGGGVGYYATVNTAKTMVEVQKETIEKAIAKETNSIKNVITNTFEKKAFKKGENINLVIDSDTESMLIVPDQKDSTESQEVEKKRKNFFNRLFNKNKN